jgi:hypothetical protein
LLLSLPEGVTLAPVLKVLPARKTVVVPPPNFGFSTAGFSQVVLPVAEL